MDKLQEIFKTEAEELIADLERALLVFEKDLENEKSVRDIFRVMHTLKGSASMFGFETLSTLTHNLETIYDGIREGRTKASLEILEVTLQSVDHLNKIIQDPKLENANNKAKHQALLEDIQTILTNKPDNVNTSTKGDVMSKAIATFYIFFAPGKGIFKNGTNPLFLIDDLNGLGKTLVLPHFDQVPALSLIKADECYASFEVVLVTTQSAEAVREVFMFVEDACEIVIEKISDTDLLASASFTKALTNVETLSHGPFGLAIVKTISASLKNVASSKVVEAASVKAEATSIRVSSDKLDELMNLVSELVTSQARLSLIAEQQSIAVLSNLSENIEKITRRLRDNAFNICLVPIETLVVRFQRLVRDLSKELKKEIEFIAEGTETELDRSIIENVTDPILHILRNCMDHGIESPAEREKNGKKRVGKIQLKAYHAGTSVFITIKDDGRGIDPEKIRRKAITKGIISEDAVLSENEILDLVFSAGFSTAEKITDVSGRGVGMDIVKRNIESIHGEVKLETKVNEGTSITIKLPLTLSIMDGMLVQIGESKYILPLGSINKCFEMERKKIKQDISQKHVLDGDMLPVFNLQEYFCEDSVSHGYMQVIKLNRDQFPVGITVDNVIGEYQAVMKPLGDMYAGQEEFSGATILGDGSVALVIDTDKLITQLIAKHKTSNVINN